MKIQPQLPRVAVGQLSQVSARVRRQRFEQCVDCFTPAARKAIAQVAASTARRVDIANVGADILRGSVPAGLKALVSECLAARSSVPIDQELKDALALAQKEPDALLRSAFLLLQAATDQPRARLTKRVWAAIKGHQAGGYCFGNEAPGVGDFQNRMAWWLRETAPALLQASVAAMPEFEEPMPGLSASTKAFQKKFGPCLQDFAVGISVPILAEAEGFVEALEEMGLDAGTTRIRGIAYSTNELAVERLRMRGYKTDNRLGREGYEKKWWGRALDAHVDFRDRDNLLPFEARKEEVMLEFLHDMLDVSHKEGKPVLIIDDGGYAATVAKKHLSPEQLAQMRFVEQTSRGVKKVHAIEGPCSLVVTVGDSEVKNDLESPHVGEMVAQSMLHRVREDKKSWKDVSVGLLGCGDIGSAVYRSFADAGARVLVYDPFIPEAELPSGAVRVHDKRLALEGHDYVGGTTGNTVITPEEFRFVSPGTRLFSTSSLDVEFRNAWRIAQMLGYLQERAVHASRAGDGPELKTPNLHIRTKIELPGSRLDQEEMTQRQRREHSVTSAFENELHRRMRKYGGNVRMRVNTTLSHLSFADLIARAEGKHAKPTESPHLKETNQIAEGMIEGNPLPEPIWIENGGFPINLSRRLVSMPAKDIQGTLACLVGAAGQAATYEGDVGEAGPVVINDFVQQTVRKAHQTRST